MLQNTFNRITSQLKSHEADDLDDQLHILISGERGKVFRIPCSKRKLRSLVITAACITVGLIFVFATTLFFAVKNNSESQYADIPSKSDIQHHASSNKGIQSELARLKEKVATLEEEKKEQFMLFEEEKKHIFGSAMKELTSRTALLDKIFRSVGIIVPRRTKIKVEGTENSGGPFLEVSPIDRKKDELLNRTDTYLKRVDSVPLGRPVTGTISSGFGKRRDPFNGQIAYHEGLDFRGQPGEAIHCTADGVVIHAERNGGYGNFVEVDHGDGYSTAYGHLKKILVKVGQHVKRGDIIGQLGNTGRSTGPHLHYEVRSSEDPIDPSKYVDVALVAKKFKVQQQKTVR